MIEDTPEQNQRFGINRNRKKARTAIGIVLLVFLIISFFDVRANIINASGIANVELYMKGVFYAVTAWGVAGAALLVIGRSGPSRSR